jgi:hypothetical protein
MNIFRPLLSITLTIITLNVKSQDKCNFINRVQNYQDSVKIKLSDETYILDSETFDIHIYLSLYDKIDFKKDFKVGVYYFDNSIGGNPYLYALKENKVLRFRDKNILYKTLNNDKYRAKNYIIPENSEEGFLQYLFFYIMGEQFALRWHSNYDYKYVVCSRQKLNSLIDSFRSCIIDDSSDEEIEFDFSVDANELKVLEQTDPEITINSNKDHYIISWIENRTHRGVYRCTYKIQKQYPYKIEMIREKLLMSIEIGFLY